MPNAFEKDIRLIAKESMQVFEVSGLALARAVGEQPIESFLFGTDFVGQPLVVDSLFPVAPADPMRVTRVATIPHSALRI